MLGLHQALVALHMGLQICIAQEWIKVVTLNTKFSVETIIINIET